MLQNTIYIGWKWVYTDKELDTKFQYLSHFFIYFINVDHIVQNMEEWIYSTYILNLRRHSYKILFHLLILQYTIQYWNTIEKIILKTLMCIVVVENRFLKKIIFFDIFYIHYFIASNKWQFFTSTVLNIC